MALGTFPNGVKPSPRPGPPETSLPQRPGLAFDSITHARAAGVGKRLGSLPPVHVTGAAPNVEAVSEADTVADVTTNATAAGTGESKQLNIANLDPASLVEEAQGKKRGRPPLNAEGNN